MTWTCCVTVPCRCCSAVSARRPRWGRSCGRSPGETSLSCRRSHRQVLAELARRAPLLPGADVLAFIDIDSQQKRVYGHAKQGAAFGHTKIQGKSAAGPRPERAGRHDLHAAGRPGDRRHPAARRERQLRPRRRVDDHRGGRHRPGCRVHRHARGADGLGVLRLPGRRRRPQGRSALLGHRPHGSQVRAAIAAIPERCLDADPLPPGHLGRPAGPLGLRRRGRGNANTPPSPRRRGQAITARLIVRRVKDLNRRPPRARASCSPPGATTPCSPTRRSRWLSQALTDVSLTSTTSVLTCPDEG